jgi:hypothetical protein
MEQTFERVYTVTEYYDGPRDGVADFLGAPHTYRSVYLDNAQWDTGEDRFELSPIAPDVLALALEDWAIWERFERAYRAGKLSEPVQESDWGALPADAPRHAELRQILESALAIDPARRVLARGAFRVREPAPQSPLGVLSPLEVCWEPVL